MRHSIERPTQDHIRLIRQRATRTRQMGVNSQHSPLVGNMIAEYVSAKVNACEAQKDAYKARIQAGLAADPYNELITEPESETE